MFFFPFFILLFYFKTTYVYYFIYYARFACMLCGAMFKLATLMHQGQGRRPDRERGVWFKQYFIQENIIINNTKTLHRNTSRADNAIMCLRPL